MSSAAVHSTTRDNGNTTEYSTGAETEDRFRTAERVVDWAVAHDKDTSFATIGSADGNTTDLLATLGRMQNDNPSAAMDLPPPPTSRMRTATFHALQEWEGYVIEVRQTEFVARLVDLTAGAQYEQEEAIIPKDEVSESDLTKMRLGSFFRWVIGYERSAAGTKKRVSQIVFRDLPVITKRDLREGNEWARKIRRSFGL